MKAQVNKRGLEKLSECLDVEKHETKAVTFGAAVIYITLSTGDKTVLYYNILK